jgi:hypothetical protein
VLGGPRSLCAPSALATLCEVHDDGSGPASGATNCRTDSNQAIAALGSARPIHYPGNRRSRRVLNGNVICLWPLREVLLLSPATIPFRVTCR